MIYRTTVRVREMQIRLFWNISDINEHILKKIVKHESYEKKRSYAQSAHIQVPTTHTHTHTHAHTHTHTHARTHTRTRTRTHARTHARTHPCTHACMHTHRVQHETKHILIISFNYKLESHKAYCAQSFQCT